MNALPKRLAIVIHLGMWSPGLALASGHTKPGVKVFELLGAYPTKEYLDVVFAADNAPPAIARNEPARLLRKQGAAYSLSVGDVIRIEKTFWRCDSNGWTCIGGANAFRLEVMRAMNRHV